MLALPWPEPSLTYLEFAQLGFGEAPLEASRFQSQLASVLQLQRPETKQPVISGEDRHRMAEGIPSQNCPAAKIALCSASSMA